MSGRWYIELLGCLRARDDEQVISRFRTQKTAALLAYLAFYRTEKHPRERLVDLLWPDQRPEAGRNSLSVALSSLRHQLEPPGVTPGAVIWADRQTVGLNPAATSTDVAAFESAFAAAQRAGTGAENVRYLREAVRHYRGELLSTLYEDWLSPERQRLADLFQQAISGLVEQYELTGNLERALEFARRGVSADPMREEAHCQLMRLYVAAGRPHAALRQYRELERILKNEWDEKPSARARELAAGIQQSASAVTPAKIAAPLSLPTALQAGAAANAPTRIPPALPTGIVSLLLVERHCPVSSHHHTGETYCGGCRAHIRAIIAESGGQTAASIEGFLTVAFARASDALRCAAAFVREEVCSCTDPQSGSERVIARVAVDAGELDLHEGEYRGSVKRRVARLLLAAHAGQIVCTEAAAALAREELPEGARLTELGSYHLAEGEPAGRVFQYEFAEMDVREFPPLKAQPAGAGRLPAQPTRFIGRRAELARLRQMLLLPEYRLITLIGPGGAGKTRLAVEVAGQLQDQYRDATWFVPLADLTESRYLADAVLDAMRLHRAGNQPPLEQLVQALSRTPTLLVLDNYEQLVAAGAEFVARLLERVASLRLLVTSRHQLDLPGEHLFQVPALPMPRAGATPEQLIACESVQLFVDHAQAVRPDFQVTEGNAAAVAEVCTRLEGLPLALSLAAGRAQVLSPNQMVAHLSHRFDLLVGRRRAWPARHRSLQAAVEWSFQLLDPALRRLFVQLSIFRGGWTVEAIECVCGEEAGAEAEDVLDQLAQLQGCSLVTAEVGETTTRFRMLETLREFAAEQMTPSQRAMISRRHAAYFLSLAERAEAASGSDEQETWLTRLDAERDNLRAALAWAIAEDHALALRLTGALYLYWDTRYYWEEGSQALAAVLESPAGDPLLRAKAWCWVGWYSYRRGDVAQGEQQIKKSYELARQHGNREGEADALNRLGYIALALGQPDTAERLQHEALEISRQLEDHQGIARCLACLGDLAATRGQWDQSRSLYQESLDAYRRSGSRRGPIAILSAFGALALREGEIAEAQRCFGEALDLAHALGDRLATAVALEGLGEVAGRNRESDRAEALLGESLAIWRELEHPRGIGNACAKLATLALQREEFGTALAYLRQSFAARRDAGQPRAALVSLEQLAHLECTQGDPRAAVRLLSHANLLREELAAPRSEPEQHKLDDAVDALRAQLGERVFNTAWREGRDLPLALS